MAASLKLRVLSPSGVLLEAEGDYVGLPASDGSLGIMHGHSPLIAALGAGHVRCRDGAQEQSAVIPGGVAEVSGNVVTVLTDKLLDKN